MQIWLAPKFDGAQDAVENLQKEPELADLAAEPLGAPHCILLRRVSDPPYRAN